MKISVVGMSCQHCVARVNNTLTALGAKNIMVDLKSGIASFEGDIDYLTVKSSIEDLGFDVEKL